MTSMSRNKRKRFPAAQKANGVGDDHLVTTGKVDFPYNRTVKAGRDR